jgi:DNA-binding CsgD family transcriptional regulator
MTTAATQPLIAHRISIGRATLLPAERSLPLGRHAELSVIRDLLRRAEQGSAAVVLVEGEPGIGKTALLRRATDEAAGRGFSLATGGADLLPPAIPFFTLLGALREPISELTADHGGLNLRDSAHSWLAKVRSRLAARAASGPVLVCLDDLHSESAPALSALQSLQRDLARQPIAWLLARSSAARCSAGRLFGLLERDGAVLLTLGPLNEDIATTMVTRAFGASPQPDLAALVEGAAGNPSLLTELISGLREDRAVQVQGGLATLVSSCLPRRVHRLAQQQLDQVSSKTRHLLKTAAVLGPAFRLEDAAQMLGEPPAALLAAVDEALDAALVTAAEHAFAFRHQLLRRAVGEMIPAPARTALHRQYAEILLSRGNSAAVAATHLLQAAHPGDPASLPMLDKAAARTLGADPSVSAELAMRAVELTLPGDAAALTRSVTAAEALAAAGRLAEACEIAEAALGKPLPQTAEYRLRCVMSWVLCARGNVTAAAAEAALVLAGKQLPRDVRDRALAAHLQAVTGVRTEPAADMARASPVRPGPRATAAALILDADRCWDRGQIRESLELLHDAARRSGVSPDAREVQPMLALAAALVDVRELTEAEAILGAVASSGLDRLPAGAALALVRGRLQMAAGHLAGAAAEAKAALHKAEAAGAHSYASTARSLLAVIELRRGDVDEAARHIACRPVAGLQFADMYARPESALAEAQIAEARDGQVAALAGLGDFCSGVAGRPGPLLADPALAPWLARAALAIGDEKLAADTACTSATVAAAYPEYLALSAAAAHAQGLVHSDPAALARAVADHTDPWARASAAEDLGVLYVRQDDKDAAVLHLKAALGGYRQVGASRDEARALWRLRQLGIRRRHWSTCTSRPAAGWPALTDAEQAIAFLVAEGLTNKQVAARMYISTHTVAHHLRQAFRKLGITSRVELARIVIEQAPRRIPGRLATLTMSAPATTATVTLGAATHRRRAAGRT